MLDRINGDLLPIKGHYFFYNGATGPMMQFLPTIAKQLGFSGFLVGTIFTILPISGLIAKPLFGGLADKFRLHKAFFIAFQAILAIAFLTIKFIPEAEHSIKTNLICSGDAFLEIPAKNIPLDQDTENMNSNSKSNAHCHLSCTVKSVRDIQTICDSWHIEKYCTLMETGIELDKIKQLDTLEFEVYFKEPYDLQVTKYLYPKILNISFANEGIRRAQCTSLRIPCITKCPTVPFLDKLIRNTSITENNRSRQVSSAIFQWFLWASIVSWVGMAVVVSIGDAICFHLLDDGKSRNYGKQKMWGSIGVGLFGIIAGYLTDLFSKGEDTKDYSCIFYLMLTAMLLDILVSSRLKKISLDNSNEPSVFWELWSIAREGRVLVFAWWCIGAGMCTGVIWNFLFWYTEEISPSQSQKEWVKTLQGLLTGVQCFLGEMPFNFISGNILRKVGHINVMSLVLLAFSIRFMAYSIITNAWAFLFVEILHGPTLGLCWPAMVSYGDKVAPSGTKATIQGFVGAIFEGIGVSLGSLLCGYLIDQYTGVVTFRIFSVGALVWLSLFWIMQLLLRKAKAYPLQQGHIHLASYTPPDDDAILMTMNQEMQTY